MRIGFPTNRSLRRGANAELRREGAEEIAISALGYLASDPERIEVFLTVSGIDPGSLREAAGQPGFAAGVLEYVCSDERTLLAFAADSGLAPERIVQAQQVLAGPPPDDWP